MVLDIKLGISHHPSNGGNQSAICALPALQHHRVPLGLQLATTIDRDIFIMEASSSSFSSHAFRTKPIKVIRAEENSQDLPRSLSLFDLLCIGIGGTVGSGIFATTGEIVSSTAGPGAVLSWMIGGIVCCFNAFSYMELTTRVPSSGSTYAYAYHALGELPAVIGGWLLTLEYAVSGAGVARSWADKVHTWIDPTQETYKWINMEYLNLLAALIQALSVVVLLVGVRFGKAFVNTVTIIKVAVVLFIVVVGFTAFNADNISPFIPQRVPSVPAFGFQGVIAGATQAFFGYIGFDEVCCLAAEAKNPKKIMPIAVIGVVLGTMMLSVFASFVLTGMVPYQNAVDFPEAFKAVDLTWASHIVRVGEVATMPIVVLIAFLAQPRLNYAMACDGLLPQIFAKVDDKGNLFVNTLITGIFFTLVALIVPFIRLWDIVTFGILLSFIMSNCSLLMVRVRDDSPQLGPKLIGSIAALSAAAAFTYQKGCVEPSDPSSVWLWIAVALGAGFLACTILLFVKCPQSANDPANFSAPLVPFIPALSIILDWYLISQLDAVGLALGFGWVALAVISYVFYGYRNAVGRTGWSALLNFLPRDSTMSVPMLSVNEVKPSL